MKSLSNGRASSAAELDKPPLSGASRAVVIGGNGFLGRAVVRTLLARGDEVVVADICGSQAQCDRHMAPATFRRVNVMNRRRLVEVFRGATEVYHFAGKLGTSELDETPALAARVNVLGSLNVFEAAIEAGVPRVFNAAKPNVWRNVYSVTKQAAEGLALILDASGAGTRIVSLRYFNAFGPGQAIGPVRKLVPTFICQALRGEALTIFGDGSQIVDLIYSEDLASLTVAYLAYARDATPVDCGRGLPMSVEEIARAVNAATGNRAGVEYLPMRPGETPGTVLVADPRSLLAAVGGHGFTEFPAALEATIRWYRDTVVRRSRVRARVA